jgi:hypothetical protein
LARNEYARALLSADIRCKVGLRALPSSSYYRRLVPGCPGRGPLSAREHQVRASVVLPSGTHQPLAVASTAATITTTTITTKHRERFYRCESRKAECIQLGSECARAEGRLEKRRPRGSPWLALVEQSWFAEGGGDSVHGNVDRRSPPGPSFVLITLGAPLGPVGSAWPRGGRERQPGRGRPSSLIDGRGPPRTERKRWTPLLSALGSYRQQRLSAYTAARMFTSLRWRWRAHARTHARPRTRTEARAH